MNQFKVTISESGRVLKLTIISCVFFSLIHSKDIVAQKFTLAVLPDTQNEVQRNPAMLISQLQWIVDKKDSLNIPFALHVGDIVNSDDAGQWAKADEVFKILDNAGIPYALTVGNHDAEVFGDKSLRTTPANPGIDLRKTTKFNSYFPVGRLVAQKGRYQEGKSDNAFYTFHAGGLDWMVLSLEYCARVAAVRWAGKVVADHPNHNIIILTHYHLNPDGDISERSDYGELSPAEVYDILIRKYPNILLVLCGHTGSSTWRNDKGDKGNRIYQVLQDYQGDNMGDGNIRLLEINPEKKSIFGKVYSPYNHKEKKEAQISFTRVDFTQPSK